MTPAEIITSARRVLLDPSKRFWSDAEMVDYFNAARTALYIMKPRIYEVTREVILTAGPRHTLPFGSNVLYSVIQNLDGSRRTISPINRELMGRVRPRWRSEGNSDEIVHFMYTESEPTEFEVYPPAKEGTRVLISLAAPPAPFQSATDTTQLTQEGALADALGDYVLHRAYLKETDASPQAGGLAGEHLSLFMAKVKGEIAAKTNATPNRTSVGGLPPAVPA